MRPFQLNDEEIAHVLHRRTLTAPQRDLIDYLTSRLAGPQPAHGPLPNNVIPLLHSCPGKL